MAVSLVIPSSFPVWLSNPSGPDFLVLDANGYRAAIAGGAVVFADPVAAHVLATDPPKQVTVFQVPLGPGQHVPPPPPPPPPKPAGH